MTASELREKLAHCAAGLTAGQLTLLLDIAEACAEENDPGLVLKGRDSAVVRRGMETLVYGEARKAAANGEKRG